VIFSEVRASDSLFKNVDTIMSEIDRVLDKEDIKYIISKFRDSNILYSLATLISSYKNNEHVKKHLIDKLKNTIDFGK
jgi:flavorubredoxin